VAVLAGCAGNDAAGAPGRPPDRQAGHPTIPEALTSFRSTRVLPSVAAPVRLSIPAIGVRSALESLGRQPDRTVAVPRDWQRAGWYRGGPRPGERGAAVILGHVDSPTGPAVFGRLATLRKGARVVVGRADGSSVTFVVQRVERHAKNRFPVKEVYWPTLQPELRLVTCGGAYARAAGGYQSNVIVFATLAGGAGAGGP
jgi:sortase family protein